MPICKICLSENIKKFETKLLNKYIVSYFQCTSCQFVQTEEPYWLDEAYSSAITSQDIGLLSRNNLYTPIVSLLIKLFFDTRAKFLDYGGGYGAFVRLMRDRGFNFFRYDTYCENIFAQSFDAKNDESYEMVTSFEVFEHLVNPLEEIEKMLNKSRSIFFSTEIQPLGFQNEKDWWYVMPETGQHLSLYSIKSLEFIASKYNLNLYSNGSTFHLLTDKKINSLLFKFITKPRIIRFLNLILKNPPSLLMTDYEKIKK